MSLLVCVFSPECFIKYKSIVFLLLLYKNVVIILMFFILRIQEQNQKLQEL